MKSADEVISKSLPEVMFSGSGSADSTGAPIQTAKQTIGQGVYVTNEDAANPLLVGPSLALALHKIKAGDCRFIPIDDISKVFLKGSGGTVAYTWWAG